MAFISLFGLLFSGLVFAQENLPPDTAFSDLSMQELLNAKAYYVQELDALVREKNELIQKGIEDGERLLSSANPKVIPDILIRLADLYYHLEKDAFLDRMKAYEDTLERRGKEGIGPAPVEPVLVFQKAIQYYQRIIDEFPTSDLMDHAMYYKAFLYEEMGQNQKANALYLQLAETHPQSSYLPEIFMRLGEYHFNPPVNDLKQAIGFYNKVMQYRNSPRYQEALYKLGWSYYRLNQYAEAISYFTTLVEQFTAMEKDSLRESKASTDLRNEAIDYIAVCFIDYGGPKKTSEYLNKIGRPDWGRAVLKKMGDIYRVQKEEYRTALSAYEALLGYSPFIPDAPQIQKSIVDCYRAMGDQDKLVQARRKLFFDYQIESPWWNRNSDERSKLSAYKLAEAAQRENVFDMIKKAENQHSTAMYQNAIDNARQYLQVYPEDLNALLVRWNLALILDSKLYRYQEALQEYLTISLVYDSETYEKFSQEKGLATVQDAALNAIVVADTLVRREYKREAKIRVSAGQSSKTDKKNPLPLTDSERWLVMASDNYIKLFPFDAKTSLVLANIGALYYTHNEFNDALRYFKTLTKNFPNSEKVQNIQLDILESYFGKADFESAEILAKKLLAENTPASDKKRIEKRLAESLFYRAQSFSEQNQPKKAASEYLRMALEVPTADFVDRAVFNAGRENEKIQDYPEAVRAYEILRTSYGGSSLLPDALNNLVVNYAALGDYDHAASRSEELAKTLNDSSSAGTALYNAFVYYCKAENWLKAADIGESYSKRYRSFSNAPLVIFKTGECYFQMRETLRAARTFNELADRFGTSRLGVEAYFRAGNLFLGMDSLLSAENAFFHAFAFHESLTRKELEGNHSVAAEGLFQASLLLEKRFQNQPLVLPQEILNRRLDEKQKQLRQLTEQYAKIAAFHGERMPESLFRIGQVHERFADSWAKQELPQLDPAVKAVRQKEINGRTAWFFKQALSSYLAAARILDSFIRVQANDTAKTNGRSDSLLVSARMWNDKSKSKVTEIIYRTAEINAKTIDELLNAPLPDGMNLMARMEYRSQLLFKAISPLVWVVVEAHKRNAMVSDSLGFNGIWADSSRTRMLSEMTLLPSEYEKLSFQALDAFRGKMFEYRRKVKEENALAPSSFVDEMVNFLEQAKIFSQNAFLFRKDEFSRADQMSLKATEITPEKLAMIRFALRMADSLDALSRVSLDDQNWAKQRFESKNDPNLEEALAVFEDNVYFLNDKMKTVLEQAYALHSGCPDPIPFGGWLGIRLVQLDPDTYSKRLNVPVEVMIDQPDSTWMCSFGEQSGWEKSDFQPKGWIKFKGTSQQDTALNSHWMFLRKEWIIPGLPVSGEVDAPTDSSWSLVLNGIFLKGNPKPDVREMKSLFRRDRNVLVVRCDESTMQSSKPRIFVRFIPDRVLPLEGRINK